MLDQESAAVTDTESVFWAHTQAQHRRPIWLYVKIPHVNVIKGQLSRWEAEDGQVTTGFHRTICLHHSLC